MHMAVQISFPTTTTNPLEGSPPRLYYFVSLFSESYHLCCAERCTKNKPGIKDRNSNIFNSEEYGGYRWPVVHDLTFSTSICIYLHVLHAVLSQAPILFFSHTICFLTTLILHADQDYSLQNK